eukprot:scaffold240992_cov42-Prasinocladus_malaysianus.AAC.1
MSAAVSADDVQSLRDGLEAVQSEAVMASQRVRDELTQRIADEIAEAAKPVAVLLEDVAALKAKVEKLGEFAGANAGHSDRLDKVMATTHT